MAHIKATRSLFGFHNEDLGLGPCNFITTEDVIYVQVLEPQHEADGHTWEKTIEVVSFRTAGRNAPLHRTFPWVLKKAQRWAKARGYSLKAADVQFYGVDGAFPR